MEFLAAVGLASFAFGCVVMAGVALFYAAHLLWQLARWIRRES